MARRRGLGRAGPGMSGRAPAFRNWPDSLSGKRKGRKVGHPRFRSRKDNRQSIRLTRSGFGVTARGVRVAKVGDVRLEWSRDLLAVPSSVTLIREADGRYSASFVVEVQDTPLPVITDDVGVDFGLTNLAVLSTGDVIENPRHLRRKARALAQRALAWKRKGSNNRKKAVARVAVLHRKLRETRLDGHHKLALRNNSGGRSIAEVERRGRTLRRWREEILVYFATGGVPTAEPKRSTA